MLVELNIKNFAILENLNINFTKGFNVLTGETGSGKSIIVEAISIVLGERASKNLVRTGCDKAIIESVFYLENCSKIKKILNEYGIDMEKNNYLLISREIFAAGGSVSRINGRTVTLSMLNNITQNIIDIHGQHEHQSLLNVENHIEFIDTFGDYDFKNLKKVIEQYYNKLLKLEEKLKKLSLNTMERDREIDLLKYQIEEISSANLSTEEESKIVNQYNKLSNIKTIGIAIGETIEILKSNDYNNISVLDGLNQSISLIEDVKEYDTKLKKVSDNLKNIGYEIQSIIGDLRHYFESIEYDDERLVYLEDRIDTINELKKKYGNTIKEILIYENNIRTRLNLLMNNEEEVMKIKKEIENVERELEKECQFLSKCRKEIGKEIEENILDELNQLSMTKVAFNIRFEKLDYYTKEGFDKVEFLISTNPGEELKPLSKIVSGGELSRIMLAFKTILADCDDIPCLIFDEIDNGISGRTAQIVGEKISNISKKRQVICISHLPQIAALADTHFSIDKKPKNGRMVTCVKMLDYKERIDELSRLLGGVNLTTTTKLHAEEMLKMSKKFKNKKISSKNI